MSPLGASAQTEDARYQKLEAEVRLLREQMLQLQTNHQREMAELKALLQQQPAATGRVATATAVATATPGEASLYETLKQTAETEKTAESTSPTGVYDSLKASAAALVPQNAVLDRMNLDIAAILDVYGYHDTTKEGISHLKEHLSGFGHHHAGEEHDHGGYENGFNLRHVELGFTAEVDPYFRAWTIVAVSEHSAELEEAVLQTTCLPYGFMLSAGKMKSGIGRLNRQHSHTWDFLDQPMVYDAFFGDHGLNEIGAQLTWLAPTPFYLLFGAEVFNGDNESSFAMVDDEALSDHDAPRLYTAFMKVGPDLGAEHALLFGLSAAGGRHQLVEEHDLKAADGETLIFGTDFVYKYDAKRTKGAGDFLLQGEYFYRDMDLDGKGTDWEGSNFDAQQDGYYLQALYGVCPRVRAGLRWDQLGLLNRVQEPYENAISYGSSKRASFMLDWKLTEFSLLRAQVGHGWYDTVHGDEEAWIFAIQWQLTFGKHGAHDF